jgi:hypothetical protein
VPVLSGRSKPMLNTYFGEIPDYENEYAQVDDIWRLTKYDENGHFMEHCDREKKKEDHKHFGTEIFLPPKSQFNYEGGELRIVYDGRETLILPD